MPPCSSRPRRGALEAARLGGEDVGTAAWARPVARPHLGAATAAAAHRRAAAVAAAAAAAAVVHVGLGGAALEAAHLGAEDVGVACRLVRRASEQLGQLGSKQQASAQLATELKMLRCSWGTPRLQPHVPRLQPHVPRHAAVRGGVLTKLRCSWDRSSRRVARRTHPCRRCRRRRRRPGEARRPGFPGLRVSTHASQ